MHTAQDLKAKLFESTKHQGSHLWLLSMMFPVDLFITKRLPLEKSFKASLIHESLGILPTLPTQDIKHRTSRGGFQKPLWVSTQPSCTEGKGEKEHKKHRLFCGVGVEEAVRTVDQARPKCRGRLAGAAWLGSSSRFTDMTSVAPVQLFLW